METVTKVYPVNNGVFNNDLTNDDLLAYPFEIKKDIAWHFICRLSSGYNDYRDVDQKVFTPGTCIYKYADLNAENVDGIMIELRREKDQRHAELLRLTANLHYTQGEQIYDMQKELQFGGFLTMPATKLVGYVNKIGSWNNFNHIKVQQAIRKLDKLVPRFHMPNNCNNGKSEHTWSTCRDYITMKFDYLSKDERAKYLEFYKKQWEPTAGTIKADSCRFELEEHERGGSCTLELIYWWD